MKVNLGCGKFKLEGFVNVDVNEDLQPDVVAFAQDYMETLPDDSVDTVYMGHMIEHITPADGFLLLSVIQKKLRPGGELIVTLPDATKAMSMLYMKQLDLETYLRIMFGAPEEGEFERHVMVYDAKIVVSYFGNIFSEHEIVPITNVPYLVAYNEWQSTVIFRK
jgi:predicted SAM-dependent methyltransferase